jgi:hypothetical protein
VHPVIDGNWYNRFLNSDLIGLFPLNPVLTCNNAGIMPDRQS